MSLQSRRRFLQKSSLLAAVTASGVLPRFARGAETAMPKLGIQLYSLRGYSRDEALKHASEIGFQ
ncbi:MAG: twin-arginine translocation signal domain-containing protein, partial [Planctomycetaceae bacterium]|nr:twin-arginine translocation signal domain-containing protein [Planctomycetaceae bacterium]